MTQRNFYNDGFETGKNWNDNYRPGGPWRCTDTNTPRYAAAVIRDKENSVLWFKGFDKGLEYQKVFKRLKRK